MTRSVDSNLAVGGYYRGCPREEVESVRALIMRFIDNDGVVNLDTVYSDPSEPGDQPMYEAVQELLDEGVIVGPHVETPGLDHTTMVYRASDVE